MFYFLLIIIIKTDSYLNNFVPGRFFVTFWEILLHCFHWKDKKIWIYFHLITSVSLYIFFLQHQNITYVPCRFFVTVWYIGYILMLEKKIYRLTEVIRWKYIQIFLSFQWKQCNKISQNVTKNLPGTYITFWLSLKKKIQLKWRN